MGLHKPVGCISSALPSHDDAQLCEREGCGMWPVGEPVCAGDIVSNNWRLENESIRSSFSRLETVDVKYLYSWNHIKSALSL